MNRIEATFERLKRSGQKALIGYVTAGFPAKNQTANIIRRMEKAGLDLIEIGVPFSDPVADGTTVQRASQKAIENGVTLDWVLKTVAQVRPHVQLPILFMTYTNPILAMGIPQFFARAHAAGVDGVIIPDLTPDEGEDFQKSAARHGLQIVFLVTPHTSASRLKQIAQATQGFLYAVSLNGVTGARAALPAHLNGFLKGLQRLTQKPIAVGFGISTPAHVRFIRRYVDGVIVGSALVTHLEASVRNAEHFVASLQNALNPVRKGAHHAS